MSGMGGFPEGKDDRGGDPRSGYVMEAVVSSDGSCLRCSLPLIPHFWGVRVSVVVWCASNKLSSLLCVSDQSIIRMDFPEEPDSTQGGHIIWGHYSLGVNSFIIRSLLRWSGAQSQVIPLKMWSFVSCTNQWEFPPQSLRSRDSSRDSGFFGSGRWGCGGERKATQQCASPQAPVPDPQQCPRRSIPDLVLCQGQGCGSNIVRVTSLNVLGAESMIRLPGSSPRTVPVLILGNHGVLCLSYNQATSECY